MNARWSAAASSRSKSFRTKNTSIAVTRMSVLSRLTRQATDAIVATT
jgi:hypothetical protein